MNMSSPDNMKTCRSFEEFLDSLPTFQGMQGEERQRRFAEIRRDTVSRPVIYIGAGTCGLGAGAAKTKSAVLSYLETNGIEADVLEVGCIGLCAEEPLMDVQLPGRPRVSFRKVTAEHVPELLAEILFGGRVNPDHVLGQFRSEGTEPFAKVAFMDEHPFFAPQTRWVLANCGLMDPTSMDEYIARGGYAAAMRTLISQKAEEVCDAVEKSGLRGRGGGGFPTGKKWKVAQAQKADQKYLICNADEGDPGAFMDRAVIEGDPHRLLEGMILASYAIGATKAYIYIRAEYPLAIERLHRAIAQATEYGLLGHGIFGGAHDLEILIKKGAGAFVCGEETALMHSIEGKRGMPRTRPPFPAVAGLFGKPTIINNVETLANLPHLFTNGWEAFAAVGTASSKGTKVFALSGKVNRTGLIEVAMGTTVRRILFDIGGGIPNEKAFKAVQMGGPSGGCIPQHLLDIEIDYESLLSVGSMMGSGGMVVMDENTCMVDVAKFFMDFIQRESCGKCIPCREGTKRMLEILEAITHGRGSEKGSDALRRFEGVLQLRSLAAVVKDASLCGLGQSAPNPVLSTLRWFKDEYEAHIFERRCPAGVCRGLLMIHIDPELCIGCGLCARKCPTGAILGAKKSAHHIVHDKCIGCKMCVETCRFNAVLVSH